MRTEFFTYQQRMTYGLVKFLMGVEKDPKKEITRRLSSPLVHYLNEVDRFLFSGGWVFDVTGTEEEDTRHALLRAVVTQNKLEPLSQSIWRTGATTGSVLLWIRPAPDPVFYRIWMFGKHCYGLNPEDPNEYLVENYNRDTDRLERWGITDSVINTYKSARDSGEHWKLESTETHGYGFHPVVEVFNDQSTTGGDGIGEFNYTALDMACEILIQTLDSARSYHYFGAPMLLSPDPKTTIAEIQQRRQVLQNSVDKEMKALEYLTAPAMPAGHPQYIESLQRNFNDHMGISVFRADELKDTSAVALKQRAASTIAKAQRKWLFYVDYGLVLLLNRVLEVAALDGVISTVNLSDPDTYSTSISRKQPYFAPTPAEVGMDIQNAQALTALGVEPSVALRETVWPQRTVEEIDEMLVGM